MNILELYDNYKGSASTITIENNNTDDVATYNATSTIKVPSKSSYGNSSIPYNLYEKYDDDKSVKIYETDYSLSFTNNKDFTYMIIFVSVFVLLFIILLVYIILNDEDMISLFLIIIVIIFSVPMIWYIVEYIVNTHKKKLSAGEYNGYKIKN